MPRTFKRLWSGQNDIPERVARLNTRGVSAINRNDFKLARQYFEEAYKLDPKNAFALNNMGFLAEADGDRETADFYYGKAKEADQSSKRVAYATRKDVEGEKLATVANSSDESVNKAMDEAAAARRMEGGPVVLHNRDNSAVSRAAGSTQAGDYAADSLGRNSRAGQRRIAAAAAGERTAQIVPAENGTGAGAPQVSPPLSRPLISRKARSTMGS